MRGLTLVELLVTLAIASVLATLALPSWRSVMLRSHRQEARAALLQVAQEQARFHLMNQRYGAPLPNGGFSEGGRYRLTLQVSAGGQAYRATAQPVPGSPQAADSTCPVLAIDEAGNYSPATGGCWP